MKDFAAIDFETANQQRTSVCSVGIVFQKVWAEIAPKIEGLPLVAHNAPFDEECLKAVFQMYQMEYPDYEFHCTSRASRRKLGSLLPNHQLQTVAAYCGYDLTMHHNALAISLKMQLKIRL